MDAECFDDDGSLKWVSCVKEKLFRQIFLKIKNYFVKKTFTFISLLEKQNNLTNKFLLASNKNH